MFAEGKSGQSGPNECSPRPEHLTRMQSEEDAARTKLNFLELKSDLKKEIPDVANAHSGHERTTIASLC